MELEEISAVNIGGEIYRERARFLLSADEMMEDMLGM
jgi:hypothetical protein